MTDKVLQLTEEEYKFLIYCLKGSSDDWAKIALNDFKYSKAYRDESRDKFLKVFLLLEKIRKQGGEIDNQEIPF